MLLKHFNTSYKGKINLDTVTMNKILPFTEKSYEKQQEILRKTNYIAKRHSGKNLEGRKRQQQKIRLLISVP